MKYKPIKRPLEDNNKIVFEKDNKNKPTIKITKINQQ